MTSCFNLAHAQPVHVLNVLLSLLCTWPTPTVLLEYTKLQLCCIDYYRYNLHGCAHIHASYQVYMMVTRGDPDRAELELREECMRGLHAVKYGTKCIQSVLCTSLLQSLPRHQHFSAFIYTGVRKCCLRTWDWVRTLPGMLLWERTCLWWPSLLSLGFHSSLLESQVAQRVWPSLSLLPPCKAIHLRNTFWNNLNRFGVIVIAHVAEAFWLVMHHFSLRFTCSHISAVSCPLQRVWLKCSTLPRVSRRSRTPPSLSPLWCWMRWDWLRTHPTCHWKHFTLYWKMGLREQTTPNRWYSHTCTNKKHGTCNFWCCSFCVYRSLIVKNVLLSLVSLTGHWTQLRWIVV